MTALVVAILFIAVGLTIHVVVEHKASEAGRAALWVGVLLLGLALTGLQIT